MTSEVEAGTGVNGLNSFRNFGDYILRTSQERSLLRPLVSSPSAAEQVIINCTSFFLRFSYFFSMHNIEREEGEKRNLF